MIHLAFGEATAAAAAGSGVSDMFRQLKQQFLIVQPCSVVPLRIADYKSIETAIFTFQVEIY